MKNVIKALNKSTEKKWESPYFLYVTLDAERPVLVNAFVVLFELLQNN